MKPTTAMPAVPTGGAELASSLPPSLQTFSHSHRSASRLSFSKLASLAEETAYETHWSNHLSRPPLGLRTGSEDGQHPPRNWHCP